MYPVFRMYYQNHVAKRAGSLPIDGVHVSYHKILPWDLDVFMELNNGRTLTLFDLGRIPFAHRTGLYDVVRQRKWRLTVAGATVRYRKRIVLFDTLRMTTRAAGRDAKFTYMEQTLWRGDEPTTHGLFRTAIADENGIVHTDRVAEALGDANWNPPLPEWVQMWSAAEVERPWPPLV